jgi:RNA polymerase sigma factor (sigma-70 family)
MELLRPDDCLESSSISIAQFSNLRLEQRCSVLLKHFDTDFASSIGVLRQMGAPTSKLSVERLAWAVAFNLDGGAGMFIDKALSQQAMAGYKDRWQPETPWSVVWTSLTKPFSERSAHSGSSLLSELALSAACEQREDWQHPSSRPVCLSDANLAFEFVYTQNKDKVLGICQRFGEGIENPDAIADEAWSRVFCDYWSRQARKRFLGLSRISTFVCQVARYLVIDEIRHRESLVTTVEDANDGENHLVEQLGVSFDPTERTMANQLHARIRKCMDRLPAKRRIVSEMVWSQELTAKAVAQRLQVSEPAISQHLKKARETIRACLGESKIEIAK